MTKAQKKQLAIHAPIDEAKLRLLPTIDYLQEKLSVRGSKIPATAMLNIENQFCKEVDLLTKLVKENKVCFNCYQRFCLESHAIFVACQYITDTSL